MTEGGSTPFTPEGEPTGHFVALLLVGRERGYLTPDDLMAVMESVELTPALINAAIGRVKAAGIEWRDDTYDDSELEVPAKPPVGNVVVDAALEAESSLALARLASAPALRGRGRGSTGAEPRLDFDISPIGSTSDPVRMYLPGSGFISTERLTAPSTSGASCHSSRTTGSASP